MTSARRWMVGAGAAVGLALLGGTRLAAQEGPRLAPRPPRAGPVDADRVALGRQLFFDPRLSGDATLHCGSCHDPAQAFGDGRTVSTGYPGAELFRNSPSLLDIDRRQDWYWDGRLADTDCEAVVRDHLAAPYLMNLDTVLLQERLRQVPEYRAAFPKTFGEPPTAEHAISAVAEFCRSLQTEPSPLDRHLAGDQSALSAPARRGLEVFTGRGGCVACHSGPDLTDGAFRRVGGTAPTQLWDVAERRVTLRRFLRGLEVPDYASITVDPGRFAVTRDVADRGVFRTPSLRNVAQTAPYMHDGRYGTLEEVVEFYSEGGGHAADAGLRARGLKDQEKADLIVFLRACGGAAPRVEPVVAPPYDVRPVGPR